MSTFFKKIKIEIKFEIISQNIINLIIVIRFCYTAKIIYVFKLKETRKK